MYLVELRHKVIKDLKGLPKSDTGKILEKISGPEQGLDGDIKKLTNFSPEYRLRVGNYRVLFEIEDQKIVIYRLKHRNEAYTQR